MTDCIFCKIIAGELPSYKIYEDDLFFGFLDIYPRVKGHTLLIPKTHYRWVYDVPEFGRLWETAKTITNALQIVMKPEFIVYVSYGMHVPHAHIHIMPRNKDETAQVPNRKKFPKEEMEAIAKSIRDNLK
ncbi:HIT family protein [Candidatus Roizmanbacteria bacterium]|nr:HIT family protein [Candidatus Roizmanbacteria bacterium]